MNSSHHKTGFVYVLTNPSMPDLVKVGLTSNLPEDRAKGLFNTSIPTKFNVVYRATTSRPKEVEKKAHEILKSYRENSRREFFRVDKETAIKAVQESLILASGINSWYSLEPHNLISGDRITLTLEEGQVFALINYKNMASIMNNKPDIIDLWQAHSDGDTLDIHVTNSPSHISGFSTDDPDYINDPVPYLNREKTIKNIEINGRERVLPGERLVWIPRPNNTGQNGAIFEAQGYCQIISRTLDLKSTIEGYPLLLNSFLHKNIWREAKVIMDKALKLEAPNLWVSRYDIIEAIGHKHPSSEYWLPQLIKK